MLPYRIITQPQQLKVGVIVPSETVPRWVERLCKRVASDIRFELTLIVNNPRQTCAEGWEGTSFLWYLFKLDRRRSLSQVQLDALESTSLDKSVCAERIDASHCRAIGGANFDVLIAVDPSADADQWASLARYGCWKYQFGRSSSPAPPYFDEVLHGDQIGYSALVAQFGLGSSKTIYESFGAVNPKSVYQTLNSILWKSSEFVPRCLERLCSEGDGTFTAASDSTLPPCVVPGIKRTLQFAVTILWRWLRSAIIRLLNRGQWFLAIAPARSGLFPLASEFRVLPISRNTSQADPSLITVDEVDYLFFEEFGLPDGRGRICALKIFPNGSVSMPFSVLEAPYHLSYPHVFRWNQHFYMIPESAEVHRVDLYRAHRFPVEWKYERTLLEGVQAVDTTILADRDQLWMFTNIVPPGCSPNDELYIFHSSSLLGPWRPHVMNPVVSDIRRARPAGHFFWEGDRLIRPSQDCSGRYGRAIVFNEVLELSETCYRERILRVIEPEWFPGTHCTHTIERTDRFICADGRRYQTRGWLPILAKRTSAH